MARLSAEQTEGLLRAIRSDDCLQRVVAEVERLHTVVFHDHARANWELTRQSAEQIVMAEIMCRHQGDPQGIYFALRALEDAGRSWDAAIAELAASIHSYYTTPLGIVIRRDLFGPGAVFFDPDAYEWLTVAGGPPTPGGGKKS
ncbi:MAG: hypothetical protein AB1601_08080 [Planctomycetota bacterium]